MSKDKKSKKHDDKHDKKHVGKKVKPGSKGVAKEETVESLEREMAERVAAKKAEKAARKKAADSEIEAKVGDNGTTTYVATPVEEAEEVENVETVIGVGAPGAPTPEQVIAKAEEIIAAPGSTPGAIKAAKAARKRAKLALITGEAIEDVPATAGKTVEEFEAEGRALREKVMAGEAPVADTLDVDGSVTELIEVLNDAPMVTPTEVTKPDFVRDSNDRPRIIPKGGDKPKSYSRVTSYIDVLDDKTSLSDWKMRVVAVGMGIGGVEGDSPTNRAATSLDVFNMDIEEINDKELNSLFGVGEREVALEEAEKRHNARLKEIANQAFAIGDGHVKAERGTHIHELTEILDLEGWDALPPLSADDEADLKAYEAACKAAGIKVLAVEEKVVNDEITSAGTLDRRVMYKRPGGARAFKAVADLKTGRIDYGKGKISMQIAAYAASDGYNVETGERYNLGVSKKIGLLIHLPAGKATCTIYEVDLETGARGLKLAAEVREWRNALNRKGNSPFTPLDALAAAMPPLPEGGGTNDTIAE